MTTSDKEWTYGAEHELADWDCRKGLPKGYKRAPDYTIVNSDTIAAQLDTKLYHLGGEINTPPTKTPKAQAACLGEILEYHPDATINYRSNLHIHIRVPGLKDNLQLLQRIQRYIYTELRPLINLLEPIPKGTTRPARKRERRMYVSHHTFLTKKTVVKQLWTETTKDFFSSEVPHAPDGRILWHLQPRSCVNLRQLLQTDTIEFRHFPGTLDTDKLLTCIEWCRDFLTCAIEGTPLRPLLNRYLTTREFPSFPEYSYKHEIGYQATCAHGKFTTTEVKENIRAIKAKVFDADHPSYRKAVSAACGLSR